MNNLESEKKVDFRPAWIGIAVYVVTMSAAESVPSLEKYPGLPVFLVAVALSAAAIAYLCKSGRAAYLGFSGMSKLNGKALWFGIPFFMLASVNLWHGFQIRMPAIAIALHIGKMICVGFLEEFLFRGLLFHAMAEENVKSAIVVSSITFGLGHVVNLLNNAELVPTILQMFYAMLIGLAFTMFVYRTNNIFPCIICHVVLDSLSIFSVETTSTIQIVDAILLAGIALVYAVYLKRVKPEETKRTT